MAVGETQTRKHRRKMPSFSSSLLDAIYHSVDHHQPPPHHPTRNAQQEIESLLVVEKWIQINSSSHLPSNSTIFTSSLTDSSAASRPTPKPPVFPPNRPFTPPAHRPAKTQGRLTRTKSRALKIYGDLKEPISPGGKIANFLNSIFSSKKTQNVEQWGSVRKSRSMKDTTTSSLASRSCLSKNPTNKSKRSVKFCPISVIVDEDSQACGHKRLHEGDEYSSINAAMADVGSQFIKKNIDSFVLHGGKKHELRKSYESEGEFDDKSCASSDLFELENIGAYEEELPVYGTTDLKMNRAIASGWTR